MQMNMVFGQVMHLILFEFDVSVVFVDDDAAFNRRKRHLQFSTTDSFDTATLILLLLLVNGWNCQY